MNIQKDINNRNIINLISWLISLIPITLIFSNAISDIIVVVCSLFFIFFSIKKNNWAWLNENWVKIGLIIYFWLIITSFFAYDKELAISRSITWIRFIIFGASLQFLFLCENKSRNRVLICGLIALIYIYTEMFLEYFTEYSIYSRIIEYFFDLGYSGGANMRVSGPFKDAPKSGIYLAYFFFPIFFGIIMKIKNKFSISYSLIFTISFLIINIILIYLSSHRASILSFIISLFLVFIYIFFKKKKIAYFLSILLFLISLAFFNFSLFENSKRTANNLINKTFLEIKDYPKSAYGTLSITALKMFKQNPIFGIGIKNYRIACEKEEFLSEGHKNSKNNASPWGGYYDPNLKKHFEATCSSHPHNLYLTWLTETGLIGLSLFCIFLFILFQKIFKFRNNIKNEIIAFGIIISLIPKLLPMMPSLNFFSNWNSVCFWFLIGWLFSYFPKEKLQ